MRVWSVSDAEGWRWAHATDPRVDDHAEIQSRRERAIGADGDWRLVAHFVHSTSTVTAVTRREWLGVQIKCEMHRDQSNLLKGGIGDWCCHLVNQKLSFVSSVASNCMFWLVVWPFKSLSLGVPSVSSLDATIPLAFWCLVIFFLCSFLCRLSFFLKHKSVYWFFFCQIHFFFFRFVLD